MGAVFAYWCNLNWRDVVNFYSKLTFMVVLPLVNVCSHGDVRSSILAPVEENHHDGIIGMVTLT